MPYRIIVNETGKQDATSPVLCSGGVCEATFLLLRKDLGCSFLAFTTRHSVTPSILAASTGIPIP